MCLLKILNVSICGSRCVRARRTHEAQAAAAGISDTEHLAQGSDEQGRYSWTQTDDEVEVNQPLREKE